MPDAPVHPAIQRVVDAAAARGVTLEVKTFEESTHTAVEAAAALGAALGQIVKSLVFVAVTDHGEQPVIGLVGGQDRVDLARLAVAIGAPDVRRATAREARDLTGFTIGGIPPIAHASSTRVVMDPGLHKYDVVWAAAGLPTAVFPIKPGELEELADATVGPIAELRAVDQDTEGPVASHRPNADHASADATR